MGLEWFSKLKEIDSLTKMKQQKSDKINEQASRIHKLQDRLKSSIVQAADLRKSIIYSQSVMADIDKNLKTAEEQKQRLINIGGEEKKIEKFSLEMTDLEDKGLVLLEKIESLEKDFSENKIFQQGLENTIYEISKEAELEISQANTDITNFNLRIELLKNELPTEFKTLLNKTTGKNLAHGPFTRIEQGSCFFCRFKISRLDESEVDMLRSLKTCTQCDRIFLPFGA